MMDFYTEHTYAFFYPSIYLSVCLPIYLPPSSIYNIPIIYQSHVPWVHSRKTPLYICVAESVSHSTASSKLVWNSWSVWPSLLSVLISGIHDNTPGYNLWTKAGELARSECFEGTGEEMAASCSLVFRGRGSGKELWTGRIRSPGCLSVNYTTPQNGSHSTKKKKSQKCHSLYLHSKNFTWPEY